MPKKSGWLNRVVLVVFAVSLAFGTFVAAARPVAAVRQGSTIDRVVQGLNRELAGMRDMTGDFVQIVASPLNETTRQEGHVYLARGGRARWEYDLPETEVYLYDGDTSYEYKPAQNLYRMRSIPPEAYDAMPLMSVFGRRNLIDLFGEFQLLDPAGATVAGTHVVRAYPKQETDVEHIVIETGETAPGEFVIRRLFIQYTNSSNDIVFSNVLTNTGLSDGLWELDVPSGTDVVDLRD
jgi:outer membrane lipoprotein-sorting protein